MYDLLTRGGQLIDPAQGLDEQLDIALSGGRVAEIAPSIPLKAARDVRNADGHFVLPGLIDFHTHVYWGGTSLGVDAEEIARRSGTTTFVDAGSAGAGNIAGFVKHVIEPSAPRILAYINVSFPGIFIGHGYGGFALESGRAMLAQGLLPDILSSDVHVLSKDGPAYDLLAVMSKFWCLGMNLQDVVRAVTETPARALRRPELGTLVPGTPGDATIVRVETGQFDYFDAVGEVLTGDRRLASGGIVLAGKWWNKGPNL